jgi:hypothetical protein
MMRLDYQITAKCRPEHVWQVFGDIDRWSLWNPVIDKAHWVNGQPWQLGSRFFMQIAMPKRMKFEPAITEISAPNRVAWTGTAPGFKGTHWHEFTLQADDITLIKTWEEFSGFLTLFIGKRMKTKLIHMYAVWLNALGSEAEKLAGAQAAGQ